MSEIEIEKIEKELSEYQKRITELEDAHYGLTLRLWKNFFAEYIPKLNNGVETSYKITLRKYCYSRIEELEEMLEDLE